MKVWGGGEGGARLKRKLWALNSRGEKREVKRRLGSREIAKRGEEEERRDL